MTWKTTAVRQEQKVDQFPLEWRPEPEATTDDANSFVRIVKPLFLEIRREMLLDVTRFLKVTTSLLP